VLVSAAWFFRVMNSACAPVTKRAQTIKKSMKLHEKVRKGGTSQLDSDINGTVIFLTPFGSHLYGTSTPESDLDYKGVYLPTKEQILIGKIPKTITRNTKVGEGKNSKEDIDFQLYSLPYFVDLLVQGETSAIDMIHVRKDQALVWTDEWERLHRNRHMSYSRNMKAFVGYARKQAAKYGVKGSRLAAMQDVLEYLMAYIQKEILYDYERDTKLRDVWDDLPDGDHIHRLDPTDRTPYRMYQVCGKKFMETVKIREVYASIKKSYDQYGHRAELAKKNQGIDWKAVSHALRAAYQLVEIFGSGDLAFPLADAAYLRKVKEGSLDWTSWVQPHLEEMMGRVECMASLSKFPEQVDRTFWNNLTIDIMETWLLTQTVGGELC